MAEGEIAPASATFTPRRIAFGAGAVFMAILLAFIAAYFWLDTKSGHSFIARQVAAMKFDNGMKIRIGEIDGSIYSNATVRNLQISDPKGVFVTVPSAQLDWRPFSYLNGHVDIRSLTAPELRLARIPKFIDTKSNKPLLPDLDIDIARLKIDRIVVAEAVTGRAQVATLEGRAHIANRRAQIFAKGGTVASAGVAGGDKFDLALDAVPEKNKFDVKLSVDAPADGLIAAMAGRNVAMKVDLAGKGDWKAWNGTLSSAIGDGKLANLALTGREGTFTVKGTTQPGLWLGEGLTSRLLAPETSVDLVAKLDQRRVALNGNLASASATMDAKGVIDLGKNAYEDLDLNFALLRPSTFATNVGGSNVRGRVLLNGALGLPVINYNLTADRLSFDKTTLEGLVATGEARVDTDRVRIPVSARVRRVSGVNEAFGGLLTNVRLNGDLAMAGGRVLSDNLKIRSDRVDATAILLADLNRGLYTGGLKGAVNGYRVESVGMFNVNADVDLKAEARGGWALDGTVRAKSTKLFNSGVQDFLGGQMNVVAGVRYGTDGVVRINRATVVSPLFRLNNGSGSYLANGTINFTGNGFSSKYGPLSATVAGSFASPRVHIVAAKPGFGVGLSNVVADVTRNKHGFDIIAKGDTTYGPFTADLDLLSGAGPTTIDIRQANFAGIAVGGRIVQSAAGPFTGTLTGTGSGFDGTIALSASGKYQRLVVDATALNARLAGPSDIAIGRAIIDADVTLYDQPQVIADVQLSAARMDNFYIAAARAKIDYRGGSGTAQVLAEGRNNVPFRITVNAALSPEMWRVAAKGRVNGVDIATAKPMRVVPHANSYEILSSTLNVGNGSIQIAGSYGDAIDIQSRLNNFNLSVLNPMLPGYGLGGKATGSLDWKQASAQAFPSADARLQIDNFTRTSLSAQSQPVDVSLVGRLLPDGGNARAIIRRRGATVGRLQIDLRPLPPGTAVWQTRLLAAPLSGGIRYNGPADTLFSLTGLPDQHLSGTVGVAADFSGRVQAPQLTGVVRANNLTYVNDTYGTKLTKMMVRGTFTNDQLNVTELTANAGDGTISGKGFVNLSSAKGFPMQLDLDVNNAKLASSNMIAAQATGQLQVISNENEPLIVKGTLQLPETRYTIVRQGAAKVATLTGVRRKVKTGPARISGNPDPVSSLPSEIRLDVKLVADNRFFVSGMGLQSEWSANLHITGTAGAPEFSGQMALVRGTLGFAGRSFELEEGRLNFNGGSPLNVSLRLSAAADVDGTTVRVIARGTGLNPQISFSSTPTLPQDEIVARILFGNSVAELSALQAVQLAASLNSLRGGGDGLNPLGVLQTATGIDRLRILTPDATTGRGTAIAAGKYITNDVYVEIVTDARGYTATQIEISLTPALSLLSQFGSFGSSTVNVRYRKDY